MVTIIDYEMGNLGSVLNMFKKAQVPARIVSDPSVVEKSEKIVLPGVGKFDHGMKSLKKGGLFEVLNHLVLEKKVPTLGICLGMQLMAKKSEEGDLPGFGWVDSTVHKFRFDDPTLKVPHMGWNYVKQIRENAILDGLQSKPRFYFVHAYYVKCETERDVLLQANYGLDFVAGFQKENIYGFQFHPEKSHKFGMQILKNFGSLPC